ncbi:hypothetical protein BH11PSE3_BH11PSE3_30240 [soil metagenome]
MVVATLSARAQTEESTAARPDQLIAHWTASNATCRNAAASAIDAVGACEQRDTLSKLLTLANYCHGSMGNGPPSWTPCGGDPSGSRPSAKAQRDQAQARTTASFQRMGGVFVLPVLLNGATRSYVIVDSGAATVQIPEELAEEMKRNGTLTDADGMGQHRFILADGRGMQQRVVRLKSLQIGERSMENVTATIGAPRTRTLLGQSFLRRLNWWKVDNVRNAIEFEFTGAF